MVIRKNPCHNCEEREPLCRLDCTAWAEYIKKRDAEYVKANKLARISSYTIDRIYRLRKMAEKHKRH